MGHKCFGAYKDPKNCDKCIDLTGCLEATGKAKVKKAKKIAAKTEKKIVVDAEKKDYTPRQGYRNGVNN